MCSVLREQRFDFLQSDQTSNKIGAYLCMCISKDPRSRFLPSYQNGLTFTQIQMHIAFDADFFLGLPVCFLISCFAQEPFLANSEMPFKAGLDFRVIQIA